MCEVVKDQKELQVSQAWRLRPASGYLESLSSVLLGTGSFLSIFTPTEQILLFHLVN